MLRVYINYLSVRVHVYVFCFNTTRWVAVYLETHCNIGSKRAFPTGVLNR